MGGLTGGVPFLHSKFFRPSGGDLRLELMAHCQSGVSNIRRLKELLGGVCRIPQRGSAWNFTEHKWIEQENCETRVDYTTLVKL
jgi:hypothetical protein